MDGEIINRVANSSLITIDLEDWYPEGTRSIIDIKDWLYKELILKEKDFREQVKKANWEQYKDHYVALTCSSDAIIPGWAYMLIATFIAPFAKNFVIGSLEDLENKLYQTEIDKLDVSMYQNKPVIIKGCSNKPVPENAYINLIQKVQPVAKSIMYGEACSSVPLYKKAKR